MTKPKKITKKEIDKAKPTKNDSNIEELLVRSAKGDEASIVNLGRVVESTLKGEFGAILKALTAGRISTELAANKDGKLSSDRILGRLEMCDILWNDLEQFVLDKDKVLAPQTQTEGVKTYNYTFEPGV